MKRSWYFLIFLCIASLGVASSARWHVIKSIERGSLSGGALLKSVTLREISTVEKERETIVTAVVFKESAYQLQVIDNPLRDKKLAQVMSEQHFLAGVNGAYFHPDGKPLGLMISQGKIVHVQETARLLSGFVVMEGEKLQLLRVGETMPTGVTGVLQAGPFLIDHQAPVAGLEATRIARRTFVATDGHGLWMIGVISPVTLAKAARILLAAAPQFFPTHPIKRALNLDGGSSSALWVDLALEPFSQSEMGTVRNFVGMKCIQAKSRMTSNEFK